MIALASSNLRIGGLASGLDTESIIKDLMKAQRARLAKYEQNKTLLEWKREDYRKVNNALRTLKDATFNMRLQGSYLRKLTSSSDDSVVQASAATAGEGTYDIVVTRLASVATKVGSTLSADPAAKIDPSASLWSQREQFVDGTAGDLDSSANFVWGNEGDTFTFAINGVTFSFANTITLDRVMSEVNANEKAGVTMLYDSFTDRVVITTKATGDNKSGDEIVFSNDSSGFLNGLLQLSGAVESGGQNAQFSINGLTTERTSNTFQMNGVTFTLKSVSSDPSTPVRVEVKQDTEGVFKMISEWVSKYNETIDSIYSELTETRYPDYKPLTDEEMEELTDRQIDQWEEKARSGLLKHDTMIMSEMSKIRIAAYSRVEGLDGEYTSLASIGITTGSYYENGKLHIDEDALRKAIETDLDQVIRLFTNSSDEESEVGVATRVYRALDNAVDRITDTAGTSADLVDTSRIGKQIQVINDTISREEDRLQQVEERYWRQFTALERFIAQMNSQSAWLTSLLGGGNRGA
jgi:flagellar hook-associated protein 2